MYVTVIVFIFRIATIIIMIIIIIIIIITIMTISIIFAYVIMFCGCWKYPVFFSEPDSYSDGTWRSHVRTRDSPRNWR